MQLSALAFGCTILLEIGSKKQTVSDRGSRFSNGKAQANYAEVSVG
jgi:hypothetical protein